MNFDFFRELALTNDWSKIWPEISLAVLALGLLVLETVFTESGRKKAPTVAIWGLIVILGFCIADLCSVLCGPSAASCCPHPADGGSTVLFSGMLLQTSLTATLRVLFLFTALLVCFLAQTYFSKQKLPRVEYFHIILVLTAAFMLLVQSNHFVMLFVALETVTIGFYIMVSFSRTNAASLEAGIKYLILGALSSSLLLFGIVLLYGIAGNPLLGGFTQDPMDFKELAVFISLNADNNLVRAGVILVLCGVAFKIGAVPFQVWVPDVYQGSPTPTTSFLAVASKMAGFMVLINLISGPFAAQGLKGLLIPLFSTICVFTILMGNIAALTQHNVKRMIGLSGVAHAGYLLAGVLAYMNGVDWAIGAVIFYIFTYILGSFAVFSVMSHISGKDDSRQLIEDYEGLAKKSPLLALALTLGLGSLAGIPPLTGFIGKFILFIAVYEAELYSILAVSIIGVVISIYYYFGWIRESTFRVYRIGAKESPEDGSIAIPVMQRWVLILLSAGILLTGLYQGCVSIFL